MSSDQSEKAFYQRLPPSDGSAGTERQAVQSVATSAAAANAPLFTGLGANAPMGWVYVLFEAVGFPAYIRLKQTATAAATTAANGIAVPQDAQVGFWVNPNRYTQVDVLATGVGTLKWYVASPDSNSTNRMAGAP